MRGCLEGREVPPCMTSERVFRGEGASFIKTSVRGFRGEKRVPMYADRRGCLEGREGSPFILTSVYKQHILFAGGNV